MGLPTILGDDDWRVPVRGGSGRLAMRVKPPPAVLAGDADELEAQFYEALRSADLEALMALWADDDEIVCIHPGGARLVGAAAIRASFAAIFANGGIPVHPEQLHRLHGAGSALHHLVERITVQGEQGLQTAWVMATNCYIKTASGWRLVSHHASPGLPAEAAGAAETGGLLH